MRERFTLPRNELDRLEALKQRAGALGARGNKGVLVRAGLRLLADLDDAALVAALQAVPRARRKRSR